ncbi:MAG: 4-amino-4-deoxychorismate lyase [Psychrobacter glaciei]|jgi:4-amino-4-deoxychorismate lyase
MWVIEQDRYIGEVDTWDRGVQFGDGLFETIRVIDQCAVNLDQHVKRLNSGLATLLINPPSSNMKNLIKEYVTSFVAETKQKNGIFKVIITRGSSVRGYGFEKNISANITAFYAPLPHYENTIYSHGVELTVCKTQCSIQTQLAGLKHLNRLENVLAKQELSGAFEGLMLNHLGHVIEGTMSNLFFEKDNILFTPRLNLSGVSGVVRACVLLEAEQSSIDVKVKDITLSELETFSSGFICNSVMGIVPIKNINQYAFRSSNITKQLQSVINHRGVNEQTN